MTSSLPPVAHWSYPFASRDGQNVTNPRYYQDALRQARGGSYPIGRNGLWHGGVHFDDGTAGMLDQSSVRCIADGEVVAYRVDRTYPHTRYGADDTSQDAPFSTGFVLVRHRLQMPATVGPTPPELAFFSLYMHLQDWTGYQNESAHPRPAFWRHGDTRYRVKADVADALVGLKVCRTAHGEMIGVLPRGSTVTLEKGQGDWRILRASTDLSSDLVGGSSPCVR